MAPLKKIVAFFEKNIWGAFWRFSAQKRALHDSKHLNTLDSLKNKNPQSPGIAIAEFFISFTPKILTKIIEMNTGGGAGNVRGILSELQTNVARKKNDLALLDGKIKESQISLNQLIQPKLQKLTEEKEEKERQITELESLLVSKEKCRLEIMDEHSSALHRLKSMGESLEAMEEKIQDKKVEGVENSRYLFFTIFLPKLGKHVIFWLILILLNEFYKETSNCIMKILNLMFVKY